MKFCNHIDSIRCPDCMPATLPVETQPWTQSPSTVPHISTTATGPSLFLHVDGQVYRPSDIQRLLDEIARLKELVVDAKNYGPGYLTGMYERDALAIANSELRSQVHSLQQQREALEEQLQGEDSPMLHAKVDRVAAMIEAVYRRLDESDQGGAS